jgi:hypothetical protein
MIIEDQRKGLGIEELLWVKILIILLYSYTRPTRLAPLAGAGRSWLLKRIY